MTWSARRMFISAAAFARLSVSRLSQALGAGEPDGWLCTSIIAGDCASRAAHVYRGFGYPAFAYLFGADEAQLLVKKHYPAFLACLAFEPGCEIVAYKAGTVERLLFGHGFGLHSFSQFAGSLYGNGLCQAYAFVTAQCVEALAAQRRDTVAAVGQNAAHELSLIHI